MTKSKKDNETVNDYDWYLWSQKTKSYFETRYQHATTAEAKEEVAHDMQDALWGIDIVNEKDMKKINNDTSEVSAIWSLYSIGYSKRRMSELQQKIRPFLIVGALLSAGLALHNHTDNLKTNPMMGVAAGLVTCAALSKLWQNSLPPYPPKPNFRKKEEAQR